MDTGVTPLTPTELAKQEQEAEHPSYLHRVIKGIDEEANVITGGNLGQSISSRVGLDAAKGEKPAEDFARVLDVFESDHSVKAEVADEIEAEKVVATEEISPDIPKEGSD